MNVSSLELDPKVLVNVGQSTNPQNVWQYMRLSSSLLRFTIGAKVDPLLTTEVTTVESTMYVFPVVRSTAARLVQRPCRVVFTT